MHFSFYLFLTGIILILAFLQYRKVKRKSKLRAELIAALPIEFLIDHTDIGDIYGMFFRPVIVEDLAGTSDVIPPIAIKCKGRGINSHDVRVMRAVAKMGAANRAQSFLEDVSKLVLDGRLPTTTNNGNLPEYKRHQVKNALLTPPTALPEDLRDWVMASIFHMLKNTKFEQLVCEATGEQTHINVCVLTCPLTHKFLGDVDWINRKIAIRGYKNVEICLMQTMDLRQVSKVTMWLTTDMDSVGLAGCYVAGFRHSRGVVPYQQPGPDVEVFSIDSVDRFEMNNPILSVIEIQGLEPAVKNLINHRQSH